MRLRNALIIAGALALGGIGLSFAQVLPQPGPPVPVACAYNTAPPTLTNGQAGWAQCDSTGQLLVAGTGGGAVTIANSADVAEGATTDAAVAVGAAGTVSAKLRLMTSQLDAISTSVQGAIPAGTAIIGKVGIDQTTDGTTNAVRGKSESATGAAPPASVTYSGGLGSGATGGLARANIICDLHTFYTGSDNGSKTLIAGVSGRKTYICGFLLQTSTTATTLTLYKGTDADCATSGAAIGPPYALVANDRVGANSAFWNGFVTATNADYVCINASAGNPHTAEIWYAIQ